MMGSGKVVATGLIGVVLASAGGCVSLDDHNRLKAANLSLRAEKEHLETELYDQRNLSGSLQSRTQALEDQLTTKDALVNNLQSENDRLADAARAAQQTVEQMAEQYRPGDIAIAGPKLPKELDSALKAFADAHGESVSYDPRFGTMKWKGDLLFALGRDVVVDSALGPLADFAKILESPAAEGFEAVVVGHTDTVPISHEQTRAKHPTNWHLSAHRAIAVGNVLAENGYDRSRIDVMGCGEFRPIASNETEEGRSLNRRVEIYLIPRGSIVPAPSQG